MLTIYALALGGIMLGQLAPGPNLLAVMGAALGQGRRQAIVMAAGVATVTLLWAVAAGLGLSAILAVFPALMTVMKLLGGAYLIFLSVKAFLSARRGGNMVVTAQDGEWTLGEAWRRGVLVNLSNPKSALMWGAVTTYFLGSGMTTAQVLAFAPAGALSAFLIFGGYGALFSTGVARRIYARAARTAQMLFGAMFGLIGAELMFDGARSAVR